MMLKLARSRAAHHQEVIILVKADSGPKRRRYECFKEPAQRADSCTPLPVGWCEIEILVIKTEVRERRDRDRYLGDTNRYALPDSMLLTPRSQRTLHLRSDSSTHLFGICV